MIRGMGIKMVNCRAWVEEGPLVVSYCPVQSFKYHTALPFTLPIEFISQIPKVLEPTFVKGIMESLHTTFLSWTETQFFMRPKNLIEVPCTQPREGSSKMERPNQGPSFGFSCCFRKAINTCKAPLGFWITTNNCVNMIGGGRDYLNVDRFFPE